MSKTILVTGSSGLIGSEVSLLFADPGPFRIAAESCDRMIPRAPVGVNQEQK